MDCISSDPQEYQESEKCHQVGRKRPVSLYEPFSFFDDTLKPKNCENTLKLNNLVDNVNSSLSHISINPSIQLTKRNVLRDDTNTHHLKQKRLPKDEEKENQITEVYFPNYNFLNMSNMTKN